MTHEQLKKWHKHFCWLPTQLKESPTHRNGRTVWLRTIERRLVGSWAGGVETFCEWEYREKRTP